MDFFYYYFKSYFTSYFMFFHLQNTKKPCCHFFYICGWRALKANKNRNKINQEPPTTRESSVSHMRCYALWLSSKLRLAKKRIIYPVSPTSSTGSPNSKARPAKTASLLIPWVHTMWLNSSSILGSPAADAKEILNRNKQSKKLEMKEHQPSIKIILINPESENKILIPI